MPIHFPNIIPHFIVLGFMLLLPLSVEAQDKIVKVAIDAEYAPYEFQNSDGKAAGFLPSLLREIGSETGITFEFIPMNWPNAILELESGRIDLVNMIRTPERINKYLFSEAHSGIEQALFRHKQYQHIEGLDSISGETVILQKHDIAEEKLAVRDDFKRLTVDDKQTGFIGLNAGKGAAFFSAEQPGLYFIKEHNLNNIELARPSLWPQDYCFTAMKGNSAIIGVINVEMEKLRQSGRYDEIFQEWMVEPESWLIQYAQLIFLGFMILLITIGIWNRLAQLQNRKLQKAMQLLELSEKRYRELYENSPLGYQSLDTNGQLIELNPTLCWMLGYSRDEMIGKWFGDFLTPESAEKFKQNFSKVKAKGQVQNVAFDMVTKGGKVFSVEIDGRIGYDDRGNFKQSHCVVTDISNRKKTEALVLKLSKAIDQTGESILITDKDGIIEYVNPAFTAITQYPAEEVLGKHSRLLNSDNQNEAFYSKMWETISGGEAWHGRIINRKKDGTFFPAVLNIAPIVNESGIITHYIGTHADMTELDEMEMKFYQAQKMEAIGTLVGGIAHDFNNILAGMAGNLYLAKTSCEDKPDVVEHLNIVEKLSFRAADMIQQMLTFARKGRVNMRPIPLPSYLNETLKLIQSSVPENINFQHEICNDQFLINGDTTQLHQVLLNLVNNATDAVEHTDNPTIYVKLEMVDINNEFIQSHVYFKAGLYAHLSIEDNGCGIEQSEIKHLCDPFYTTKEQGKGTGLGLSMVFGAIKTHLGYLEIESNEDKGSIFHVYIPVLEVNKPISETEENLTASKKGGGEVILVVDDEELILNVSRKVLAHLNYKVLEASDGLEAIDVFTAHQHDISLIIMDMMMPRLGGLEAVERIREIQPEIKVIFATGYDKEATLQKDSYPDDVMFISKPYNINDLSNIIREQLDT